MDDDIQLPPLPPRPPVVDGDAAMINYGRACYKAGLVIGERRAKVDKVPVVHSTTMRLAPDGYAWRGTDVEDVPPSYGFVVTLRWTDGRVWIESERNRELAAKMRNALSVCAFAEVGEVAAALDGGVR